MKEPEDWWQSHYGAAIPIAHRLRFQVPDRWFRIHSLPQSKRYPQKPSEYSGLLARHNTVATDILGSQKPLPMMKRQISCLRLCKQARLMRPTMAALTCFSRQRRGAINSSGDMQTGCPSTRRGYETPNADALLLFMPGYDLPVLVYGVPLSPKGRTFTKRKAHLSCSAPCTNWSKPTACPRFTMPSSAAPARAARLPSSWSASDRPASAAQSSSSAPSPQRLSPPPLPPQAQKRTPLKPRSTLASALFFAARSRPPGICLGALRHYGALACPLPAAPGTFRLP